MNRRHFIRAAVSGVAAISTTAALSALPIAAAAHPDAELLAAWASYRKVWCALNGLPAGAPRSQVEPLGVAEHECAAKIEQLPARTLAGIEVKLRHLYGLYGETTEAQRAAIDGGLAGADAACEDDRHRLILDAIRSLQRLGMMAV